MKELFVFPGYISADYIRWQGINSYAVIGLVDGIETHVAFTFKVPHDFHSLVKVCIVITSHTKAGNMCNHYYVSYGAAGETRPKHEDKKEFQEEAITTFKIIELIDISDLFAELSKGDYIGVRFVREANNALDTVDGDVYLLGLLFKYNAS